MSGVMVATMIRSICSGVMPPFFAARNAAWAPMWEVNSLGAAMRRCRMPVRLVIHSSDVSTIFSRSALVRILSGTYDPREVIEQVRPRNPCLARGFLTTLLLLLAGGVLRRQFAP